MLEKEIIDKIEKKFEVEGSVQRERRVIVKIAPDKLVELCKFIKDLGFEHLSSLSVTDWPKRGIYEHTYHAWSYKDKILITIKTEINRDKPEIDSVYPVWGESAQIHEREMHELFGVEYKGNPDLSPLFPSFWKNGMKNHLSGRTSIGGSMLERTFMIKRMRGRGFISKGCDNGAGSDW